MNRQNEYPERAIIDSDDEVIGGKPALAGTRISLEIILDYVATGQKINDILDSYPHLDRDKLGRAIETALIARECLKSIDAETVSCELLGRPLNMDYKASPDVDILRSQRAYFDSIKAQLLANPEYRDRFVAIKDKVIIDVGDDEFDLVDRVQRANPGQVVLVKKVVPEDPVYDLPSPEVKTLSNTDDIRRKLSKGLEELDRGEFVPHDQIKNRVKDVARELRTKDLTARYVDDLVDSKLRSIEISINRILARWKRESVERFLVDAHNGALPESENDAIDLTNLVDLRDTLRKLKASGFAFWDNPEDSTYDNM